MFGFSEKNAFMAFLYHGSQASGFRLGFSREPFLTTAEELELAASTCRRAAPWLPRRGPCRSVRRCRLRGAPRFPRASVREPGALRSQWLWRSVSCLSRERHLRAHAVAASSPAGRRNVPPGLAACPCSLSSSVGNSIVTNTRSGSGRGLRRVR